jgi:hypothetical protein
MITATRSLSSEFSNLSRSRSVFGPDDVGSCVFNLRRRLTSLIRASIFSR